MSFHRFTILQFGVFLGVGDRCYNGNCNRIRPVDAQTFWSIGRIIHNFGMLYIHVRHEMESTMLQHVMLLK